MSYDFYRWSRGGYLRCSPLNNVANKNTHCLCNGHLKPFENTQASLAFSYALSCCVFLSVVEPGRIELPSKQAITKLSTCLVFVQFSMCS